MPASVTCSSAARLRGDDLVATAPPARRFFLLEVPGAWPADVLAATGLPHYLAYDLGTRVQDVSARLLLVRRPHRHPADRAGRRRWAVVAPGTLPRWGTWQDPADLAALDLPALVAGLAPGTPERPIALVCTHAKHDVCCAVEGRPVLRAADADPRFDVWECSHLSGDRFAGNLLCLPSGLLFGALDGAVTGRVLDAVAQGRVVLDHFRGRCGEAPLAQAARWHLMRMLGEDRPDEVQVELPTDPGGGGPGEPPAEVAARHAGERYRLALRWSWAEPHLLTCRARRPGRARVYAVTTAPERIA